MDARRPGQEQDELVEKQADEDGQHHHPEIFDGRRLGQERTEVVPEGDQKQGEQEERADKAPEPGALVLDGPVDGGDEPDRRFLGLIPLADDHPAFLDRVKDGVDGRPGVRPPDFGFDPVEGDVGREKDVGQADQEALAAGREVEDVDFGRQPVLGFLDFEDLVGLDRSFLAVGSDEIQPALGFPVDEEAFRENQAGGRDLFQQREKALLKLRGETLPVPAPGSCRGRARGRIAPGPRRAGRPMSRGAGFSAIPGRRRKTAGHDPPYSA